MIDFKYALIDCPICGKAFIQRDKRRNFCDECSKDEKKKKQYNEQKRISSDIQRIRKNIMDMLRRRGSDYFNFMEESRYYAELVSKKATERNPKYNANIRTASDYKE